MSAIAKLHDYADKKLREEAIDNLTQKLQSGQRAGRLDFTELLDSEITGPRCEIILSELSALLQTTTGRDYLADQIRDGIIERYLNAPDQEWLITEEMGQIEYSEPYFEDARELGLV